MTTSPWSPRATVNVKPDCEREQIRADCRAVELGDEGYPVPNYRDVDDTPIPLRRKGRRAGLDIRPRNP